MMNHLDENSAYILLEQLKPDCERCFGLCCVALPFAESADFPVNKSGGEPCRNLRKDNSCSIHNNLITSGYKGCSVFECFGAGQKVSQHTFLGHDWRHDKNKAVLMFRVLPVMHQLHEMLWYLAEAQTRAETSSFHKELESMYKTIERITMLSPEELLEQDMPSHRTYVNEMLLKTSELVRMPFRIKSKHAGKRKYNVGRYADLMGAKLSNENLKGTDLRGAYLIAADLREADMRFCDLIGADLRDADIRGADLTGSLFLTQAQVNAARGDASTKLPDHLKQPAHWGVHVSNEKVND